MSQSTTNHHHLVIMVFFVIAVKLLTESYRPIYTRHLGDYKLKYNI